MSFIQEPTAPSIDVHGAGNLLDDTRITDQQKDAAWALLQRRCPNDADQLGRMLGVNER